MTLCRNCEHESHCGKTCAGFVGIGMTDKYDSCECNYCRCMLCTIEKNPGQGQVFRRENGRNRLY